MAFVICLKQFPLIKTFTSQLYSSKIINRDLAFEGEGRKSEFELIKIENEIFCCSSTLNGKKSLSPVNVRQMKHIQQTSLKPKKTCLIN